MTKNFELDLTITNMPRAACQAMQDRIIDNARKEYFPDLNIKPSIRRRNYIQILPQVDDEDKLDRITIYYDFEFKSRPLDLLIVFAHELGHMEDFFVHYKGDLCTMKEELSSENQVDRIPAELRAWIRGALLLHREGFREWARFMDLFDRYLPTYAKDDCREDEVAIIVSRLEMQAIIDSLAPM